jgi:hypothetical protein
MDRQSYGDRQLRDFLLGRFAEAEREALERACFAFPDLLERVEAIEQDLILDYLRNRGLDPRERVEFENAYRRSKPRWRRVEELRALTGMSSARRPRGFYLAIAASVLCAVGALSLYYYLVDPPARIAATYRLESGLVRSGPAGSPPVKVESDRGDRAAIRFELGAVTGTEALPLRVTVRQAGSDADLWAGGARRGSSSQPVSVDVPARLLARGDYVITLFAGERIAATYQFRVDVR